MTEARTARRYLGACGLALAASLGGGCAPAWNRITPPGDLSEASGPPRIAKIYDLGGRDVPIDGMLDPAEVSASGDGVAVIGEALLIQGTSFGRQPTVLVADKPTAVLARTGNGGILVRVPAGTPTGVQQVQVAQRYGRGEAPLTVRRYAVVLPAAGDRVGFLEVGPDGPGGNAATPPLFAALPGARSLCVSADGRAAYVADASGLLSVFDLAAPRSPRVVYRAELGTPAPRVLECATGAHRLLVVRDEDAQVLDTRVPLRPARGAWRALPDDIRRGQPLVYRLSPDGATVAVALGDGNVVALLDAETLQVRARVVVEPDQRLPVVADLAFSIDGATLWVLAGDTADSLPGGPQATRVHALRVGGRGTTLTVARTVAVEGAQRPARLSTGRRRALPSGAAIRLPPESMNVFVAARRPNADTASLRSAVFVVGSASRADTLLEAPGLIGETDMTPDGRWLLAATAESNGALMVAAARADGHAAAVRQVPVLTPAPAGGPEASPGVALIRAQP